MSLGYERPLRAGGSVSWRLEYNYRSDFFFTTNYDPLVAQRSFGLLNASFEYQPATAPWSIFAAGRNLTDEDYFNQIFLQSSPGYPDTYEVGFRYRF